ncbi:MAG: efflux transporter outer membrane subunit [Desulfobacteraceae bacterium]
MKQKIFTAIFLIVLFSGCASFQHEKENSLEVKVPQAFNENFYGKAKIDRWWQDFNNEELNFLVETALNNNNTIKKAFETLKKADSALAKEKSDLFPDIDINGGISETRTDKNTSKSSSIGLEAGYEIDLWGKINSQVNASRFSRNAAQSDLESAAVTIASETVSAWKNYVSVSSRLEILDGILNENQKQLKVLKLRYKNGMANASDVYDHKKEILALKETINSARLEKQLLSNRLLYLTGLDSLEVKTQKLPDLPQMPETGISSDLLESRPDIKASFSRLMASEQNLYNAKKNMLPSLSISASAGLSSNEFSLSFDDWISKLAANLTAPVFRGGYLRQEVKRSKAERNEYLYSYKDIVLSAFKEVSDAVSQEKAQKEKLLFLEQRIKASEASLFYAENEYKNGSSDYISYIERYNYLKNLESVLISEKSALIEDRISLYRAIGSTWTKQFVKDMENKNE